jgi:hypothetical protein
LIWLHGPAGLSAREDTPRRRAGLFMAARAHGARVLHTIRVGLACPKLRRALGARAQAETDAGAQLAARMARRVAQRVCAALAALAALSASAHAAVRCCRLHDAMHQQTR